MLCDDTPTTSAWGDPGRAGTAMLCDDTPKEHLGLPDEAAVRELFAAYRTAAHAAGSLPARSRTDGSAAHGARDNDRVRGVRLRRASGSDTE